MLDQGRFPKVFTWKEMLQAHIDHEKEIYRRGFEFDLRKIEERLHIIEALLKVIEDIDNVVRIIKTSESPMKARERLAAKYELDEIQTKAILDMKLSRLAHLEVNKPNSSIDNQALFYRSISLLDCCTDMRLQCEWLCPQF